MPTRHLVVVLAGVALATATAAHAAPRRQSPESFVRRVVLDLAANRYAVAWRSLHPSQQAAIPRAHYSYCEGLTRIPDGRTVVTVLGMRSVRIRVAGGARHPLRAWAVRLRITITSTHTGATDTVVTTAHALRVGSGWAWILSPKRFAADRRSDCGLAGPPV